MHISVAWLNTYLDRPVTADEAEHLLTSAGFPIESRQQRPNDDVMLDVEVTSNRGDVLSHIGCAREIAACSRRRLMLPTTTLPDAAAHVSQCLRLENTQTTLCPRFTARVIRGVRVAPSPDWLRARLEAVGQRSINNVVDVTNWIAFEYGQPTHVFDLDRLAGSTLVVRLARQGETLRTLDAKDRSLCATDLVVADRDRAQSLAGVIGGAESEVGPATVNVVLEAATWEPVTIRTTARRLGIRTDASHRFERRVHPATIDAPAARAAAMILKVAGGDLCAGSLDVGGHIPHPARISMRADRCRMILGYSLPDDEMGAILAALGLEVRVHPGSTAGGATIECLIPPHRLDLEREIDLIEEVARIAGLDRVPTLATLPVSARAPQPTEAVRRNVAAALAGMGFFETVTFSFVRPADAADFLPADLNRIDIDDNRRGEEPTLRPSIIPSLLRCRRANQHAQAEQPGGIRLFEVGAVFAASRPATHVEHRNLALIMDAAGHARKRSHDDLQHAIRTLRGVIDQVVLAAGLSHASLRVIPMSEARRVHAACDPSASAMIKLAEAPLGYLALLSAESQQKFDLDAPVVYAELGLDVLETADRRPRVVHPLPLFPAIDRDLSLVVAEHVRWSQVEHVVRDAAATFPTFESLRHIATFRDASKLGPGNKSVSLRVRFRAPDRTLRSQEADQPVATLVERLGRELGATLRA